MSPSRSCQRLAPASSVPFERGVLSGASPLSAVNEFASKLNRRGSRGERKGSQKCKIVDDAAPQWRINAQSAMRSMSHPHVTMLS